MTRKSSPAYAELASLLRSRILSGELRPGDRLPTEPELCAMFGVSRSTVREALRALSTQDLVVTTRGVTGGTFVRHPDPDTITAYLKDSMHLFAGSDGSSVADLLEVRDMLEVPATALAAERATREDVEHLRAALFEPTAVNPAEVFRTTANFHVLVLRMTRNAMLEAVTRPIFGVLQERFVRQDAPARFWHQVDQDHKLIMECIAAGDPEGAANAQREHLRRLRSTYLRIDRHRRRGGDPAVNLDLDGIEGAEDSEEIGTTG